MKQRLELEILRQPDDTTCGPTCLQAIYRFHGDEVPLGQVIGEVERLEHGGTYAVYLGRHAIARGYDVTLYTWNLEVFDPTWFLLSRDGLAARLRERTKLKTQSKIGRTHRAYLDYIAQGGEVAFEDLTTKLIRKFLNRGTPILTGLSSTFLYRAMREFGDAMEDDDVRGEPQGHFVVLCGYDKDDRTVLVADPMHPNPAFQGLQYVVDIDRLVCAILLGIMTQDADMLVIEPRGKSVVSLESGGGEGGRARPRSDASYPSKPNDPDDNLWRS